MRRHEIDSCHIILPIHSCLFFHRAIPGEEIEDQLEILTENAEEEIEDVSWIEQMRSFRIHPLNLNSASEEELMQLRILTPIQVKNLLRYRALLGDLVHVNELQAVPGWEPSLIRKLIPCITVEAIQFTSAKMIERFRKGESLFLIRASQIMDRSETDKDPASSKYLGGPQKMLLRFQYKYGKLLQYGLLAEKDAGEPWMIRNGFDFMSLHFFARDLGLIRKLALGDFQVNLGQGLIQWQGISTRKSANVLMIKRQDEVIKPYRSAGEINFHRGLAITLGKRYWEWTVFASIRKLSANLISDSTYGEAISSFSNSGYHRSAAELEDQEQCNTILYRRKTFLFNC